MTKHETIQDLRNAVNEDFEVVAFEDVKNLEWESYMPRVDSDGDIIEILDTDSNMYPPMNHRTCQGCWSCFDEIGATCPICGDVIIDGCKEPVYREVEL